MAATPTPTPTFLPQVALNLVTGHRLKKGAGSGRNGDLDSDDDEDDLLARAMAMDTGGGAKVNENADALLEHNVTATALGDFKQNADAATCSDAPGGHKCCQNTSAVCHKYSSTREHERALAAFATRPARLDGG